MVKGKSGEKFLLEINSLLGMEGVLRKYSEFCMEEVMNTFLEVSSLGELMVALLDFICSITPMLDYFFVYRMFCRFIDIEIKNLAFHFSFIFIYTQKIIFYFLLYSSIIKYTKQMKMLILKRVIKIKKNTSAFIQYNSEN